jgi:hypothetical protein
VVGIRAAEVFVFVVGLNVTSATTVVTPGPKRITSYNAVVRSVVAERIATSFVTSTRVLSQSFAWRLRRRDPTESTNARNSICKVFSPRKPVGWSVLLPDREIDVSALVQKVESSCMQRLESDIFAFDVITVNHAPIRILPKEFSRVGNHIARSLNPDLSRPAIGS